MSPSQSDTRAYLRFGKRRLRIPKRRGVRIALGIALVIRGVLPPAGYILLPPAFALLSIDLPRVRRWRRRMIVGRPAQAGAAGGAIASECVAARRLNRIVGHPFARMSAMSRAAAQEAMSSRRNAAAIRSGKRSGVQAKTGQPSAASLPALAAS